MPAVFVEDFSTKFANSGRVHGQFNSSVNKLIWCNVKAFSI